MALWPAPGRSKKSSTVGTPLGNAILSAMDTSSSGSLVDLSAIIALHNDGDVVVDLFREVLSALEGLNRTFEIVFVDDGSTDDTADVIQQLFHENNCVRVVAAALAYSR